MIIIPAEAVRMAIFWVALIAVATGQFALTRYGSERRLPPGIEMLDD